MADLDVTDVLDDPDFKTRFTVRRVRSGMVDGYTVENPLDPVETEGVIYPAGGSKLYRKPDGEMSVADIAIITKFPLTSGDSDYAADTVVVKGVSYTIINLNPYVFGAGFVQAIGLQSRQNV